MCLKTTPQPSPPSSGVEGRRLGARGLLGAWGLPVVDQRKSFPLSESQEVLFAQEIMLVFELKLIDELVEPRKAVNREAYDHQEKN